ncbi:MAG: hypothetical protein WAQ27_04185 [Candidatus Microsaccharimonas sp.]
MYDSFTIEPVSWQSAIFVIPLILMAVLFVAGIVAISLEKRYRRTNYKLSKRWGVAKAWLMGSAIVALLFSLFAILFTVSVYSTALLNHKIAALENLGYSQLTTHEDGDNRMFIGLNSDGQPVAFKVFGTSDDNTYLIVPQ